MSRKMRKFLRQIKAKKTVAGSLTVFVLMLLVTLSTTLVIIIPEPAKAAWWNNSWDYFKTITIDSSEIENPLVDFPIPVAIPDATADKCDGGDSIRFLNTDNNTEYKYEIEKWVDGSDRIVWVKIPRIESASDTVLLMYYGNSGASDNQDVANVWDANYIMVHHLNETSGHHNDSTSNFHNTTNETVTVQGSASGIVDGCDDFDDVDDQLVIADHDDFTMNTFTIEIWGKSDDGAIAADHLMAKDVDGNREWLFKIGTASGIVIMQFGSGGGWRGREDNDHSETPADTDWHYYVATCSGAGVCGNYEIYIDTVAVSDADETSGTWTALTNKANDVYIGASEYVGFEERWDGWLDEVRFSNIVRNSSWLNASYHSQNQTTGFLTWGSEQGSSVWTSSFSLKGLEGSNKNITWSGTAGTTVWSNATGGAGGTMEINMSINTTDNVTEIRVYCDDLDATLNASNISMGVSSDNTTWTVNTVSFSDGGSNISINSSQWANNWCNGNNPFEGTGLTNTNTSIFCRFKLTIPVGVGAATYSQSDWKVYPGYYT